MFLCINRLLVIVQVQLGLTAACQAVSVGVPNIHENIIEVCGNRIMFFSGSLNM